MLIGLIVLAVYIFGLLVLVYPIYFRLVVAKRKAKRNQFLYDAGYSFLPFLATFLALFWPVAFPYYASYWLHNRKLANPYDVKQKAIEFENRRRHYEEIRASVQADADLAMTRAMRDLEQW